MTSWECSNCGHLPTSVYDTQLYLPSAPVAGGYETDSSWDLNPDSDTETETEIINESEDEGAAVVVRRKPKSTPEKLFHGGTQITFVDICHRFTTTLKAAHMPM
jgi:rubredoxin